jgi:hypothetical protein
LERKPPLSATRVRDRAVNGKKVPRFRDGSNR